MNRYDKKAPIRYRYSIGTSLVKSLYYKVCRSYRMFLLPCVAEGSHKTLFLVFGLAAKSLSNQNERGLPPIRIEWECALVCVLLACCTSPHCRVCACAFLVFGLAAKFYKMTQITYYTFNLPYSGGHYVQPYALLGWRRRHLKLYIFGNLMA